MVANVSQSEDDESRRKVLLDRLKRLRRLLKECLRLVELTLRDLEHEKEISAEEILDFIKKLPSGKSMREPLISHGLVREKDILDALAREMGFERVDLSQVTVTPELLAAIPAEIAKRYGCFPVAVEKNTIYVALCDPLNVLIQRNLESVLKKNIVCMIAPEDDIQRAIREYYGE
jgi:hypothetical protein